MERSKGEAKKMAKRGGRERKENTLHSTRCHLHKLFRLFLRKSGGKWAFPSLHSLPKILAHARFSEEKKPLSEKRIAANFRSLQRAGSSSIATLRQIVPPSPTSQARATSRLGFAFTVHYIYKEEKKRTKKKDRKKVKRGRKRRETYEKAVQNAVQNLELLQGFGHCFEKEKKYTFPWRQQKGVESTRRGGGGETLRCVRLFSSF